MPALGFLQKFRKELRGSTSAASASGRRRDGVTLDGGALAMRDLAMDWTDVYFYVCAASWRVCRGAVGTVACQEPHPRRDGPAADHPQRRGALPGAARAVPRGDPAHRLRGRDRRPLPLRHHAPRPGASTPPRHGAGGSGARRSAAGSSASRRSPRWSRWPRAGGPRSPQVAADRASGASTQFGRVLFSDGPRALRAVERAAHGGRHRRGRRRARQGSPARAHSRPSVGPRPRARRGTSHLSATDRAAAARRANAARVT